MGGNGSKQNISGRNIWIVVLILVMILMITLAVIGALLGRLSDRDRDTITLSGDGETVQEGEGEDAPQMEIRDDQVRWETNTQVDLFKAAYANDRGEITVKSADGGKVIAPGTSNAYEFSLKNTGNVSLDFTMHLDSVFSLENRELPMQVRLRSGDRWILGGEHTWARPDMLTDVIESGTMAVNQYVTYTFEWQWPYESGVNDTLLADLNDTVIGNTAAEQEAVFELTVEVASVVTPGVVPGGPGEEIYFPWIILAFLGLFIILLILLWRTPVYVTGFLPGVGEVCLGKKKDTLRLNGRFVFPKVYMGKHSLTLGPAQCKIRLKRQRKLPGIAFENKDDLLVIAIGRKVRAIELYLLPNLTVRLDTWAAIDKDHNVITPTGVKEPDENKENTTPGGLHVSKNGELEIDAFAAVK